MEFTLNDLRFDLIYMLKSPKKVYFPQDIEKTDKSIYVKFEQGTILDNIEYDHGNLIINRNWKLDYKGHLNLPFKIMCRLNPSFYIIPGIVVNGNKYGKGNYPQLKLNEKFSFREDRCTVPSCGIVEDSEHCIGIFTDPAPEEELLSSISLYRSKGNLYFEICTPWEEKPVQYVSKFRYIKGLTNFLAISGAFQYSRRFFIYTKKLDSSMKGYYDVLRYSWEILARSPRIPRNWSDWIRKKAQLAINVFYAKIGKAHGFITTVINPMIPLSPTFSGGFLGKSIEIAFALYRIYLRNNMKELKEIAFNVTNFLTSRILPNGLFFTDYNPALHQWYGYRIGRRKDLNTRMMSEVCHTLLRFYLLAKERNESVKRWLEFVKKFSDFMVEHQLPNGSFGKWWSKEGNLKEDSGTNGAYVIWVLAELYKITKKEKYKDAAMKAGQYYIAQFIEPDEYWGDTLDANAIDKEAGHAVLRAMLYLYKITNDEKFLKVALRAAHFVASWQFTYNVPFSKTSQLGRRKFKTFGGTIVSVENMHIDPYIMFTFDFLQLWQYTGDIYWKERAIAGLKFVLQMLASEKDTLGYKEWYIGWQPEQYNHTNWGYYGLSTIFPKRIQPKGRFSGNVAWVLAVTMGTILDIADAFPDLIEINPKPIEIYTHFSFKLSKFFRNLLLRIIPF
ncbi:MAG: hypothetical protein ACTSYB_12360 [Candidatus Helarchaeota archaeon]